MTGFINWKDVVFSCPTGKGLIACCCFVFILMGPSAFAKIYNVGANKEQVSSLQSLIDSDVLKGGDVVVLSSGYYGTLFIKNKKNKSKVTIKSGAGESASFDRIVIEGSAEWKLEKLRISGAGSKEPVRNSLVQLEGDNEKIVLEQLKISSVDSILKWQVTDWKAKAADGIIINGGREIVVRDNQIKNIRNGIRVVSDNSTIEKNVIENFSGDGILGAGNQVSYKYNRIQNCYKVFNKDSDALQFWSIGKEGKPGKGISYKGVVLGNFILSTDDAKRKSTCSLRGISMYDGMYDGWLIENNVIQVNNWRGITVYGSNKLTIVHNTLFNPYDLAKGQPRIDIRHHKNGSVSLDNIVINNIVSKVIAKKASVVNVGNLSPDNAELLFADYKKYDLRPRQGSKAVDGAITPRYFSALSNLQYPFLTGKDAAGISRPQGRGRDIGAYEWVDE